MNTQNIGNKIARVKDNPSLKKTLYSVAHIRDYQKENIDGGGDEIVEIEQGTFQLIPDSKRERDTLFICGPAGSGKSYFMADYLKEYHKMYPKNAVYLITDGLDDKCLEKLDYIQRIPLDGLENDPIPYQEFKDCIVCFDDVDSIANKKLYLSIYNLRDSLLKNSRKACVSVITTSHLCTGKELRSVLSESRVIVFFPSNLNRQMVYLLKSYVGIADKIGINKIRKSTSRWMAFIKTTPNVMMSEQCIEDLNHLQCFT